MDLQQVIDTLNNLQEAGYIKVLNWETRELIITDKLKKDLKLPVEDWIDDYRNLFKGKKPGAMGDRNACIIKMTEFLKKRPDVTPEIVLAATNKYITVESAQRWKYLMQADYFISKNQGNTKDGRISKLEAYCDEIDINNISPNNTTFEYDI